MFGMIILAAIAIAISIALPQLSPFFKTLGGKIIGAMIGSVVSQGVGVATGIQEKFSFKGVALAGLTAGIAGGLDKFGAFKALGIAGNGVFAQAAQGALSNAVTQGVAVATGLQKKFSFASVAVAGVVAGVGQLVSDALPGAGLKGQAAIDAVNNGARVGPTSTNSTLSGMAATIAGAATRSLVTGTSFGDNIMAVLPDVIGSTLGRMAVEGITRIAEPDPRKNTDAKDNVGPNKNKGGHLT